MLFLFLLKVDPEVLKYLPVDIQNEIMSAWARRRQHNTKHPKPSTSQESDASDAPSTAEEAPTSPSIDLQDEDALSYTLFDPEGQPCLCGVSGLPDVKELLREWTQASIGKSCTV